MKRGSPVLALAVAAALAFSYAGPQICAQVHAHGDTQARQHAAHHHASPAVGSTVASPADAGTCQDMMHCGLTLVGPTLEAAHLAVAQRAGDDRPALASSPVRNLARSPTTPPPKA